MLNRVAAPMRLALLEAARLAAPAFRRSSMAQAQARDEPQMSSQTLASAYAPVVAASTWA